MSNLKPCPFCGEVKNIDKKTIDFFDGKLYAVHCINCHSEIKSENLQRAISWWNTRPVEEALRQEIDKLKKQVEG